MLYPSRFRSLFAAAVLVGALQTSASAADIEVAEPPATPVEPTNEWRFAIAPYFWAAGLSGDVGVFGRQPVHVDMSFSDIFDNLRFGGMTVAEAHNGTWGIFGDFIYVKVKADESITRSIRGVPVALAASVETSTFTGTLLGEYRAYSTESVSLDLMAGARIWSVDNEINASLTVDGPPLAAFSGSDGSTWVDPMIGAKARFNTGTPWFFNGWGMIGGFGAGSDLTWDVMAGVGYEWNNRVSSLIGYRALGVDYENEGFVYDTVEQGPFMGLAITF